MAVRMVLTDRGAQTGIPQLDYASGVHVTLDAAGNSKTVGPFSSGLIVLFPANLAFAIRGDGVAAAWKGNGSISISPGVFNVDEPILLSVDPASTVSLTRPDGVDSSFVVHVDIIPVKAA